MATPARASSSRIAAQLPAAPSRSSPLVPDELLEATLANLDPSLRPATLQSLADREKSPSDANRLTDFAQHILDEANHKSELSFSGDDGIFNPTQGGFTELLDAAQRTHTTAVDEDMVLINGLDGADGTLDPEMPVDEGEGEASGRKRTNFRKRKKDGDDEQDQEGSDPTRSKKDSHKEVERRRRENINDGVNQLARLTPGGDAKMGKSELLRRAADHLAQITERVTTVDEEVAKRDAEKEALQVELSLVQTRLAEEHARSMQFETSWREADDRAATAQFEVERLKSELEETKKRYSR